MKWKPITGLEFSALGAVKYSATSQEHLITDDSNQAMAYRAMPDATVRDRNPFLYTDPDNPYALPISVLPQGGIYQRTNYKMLGYDFRATGSWNHVFAEKHIVNLLPVWRQTLPIVIRLTLMVGVCNIRRAKFRSILISSLKRA